MNRLKTEYSRRRSPVKGRFILVLKKRPAVCSAIEREWVFQYVARFVPSRSAGYQTKTSSSTRQQAEDYVKRKFDAMVADIDADDFLYYFDASRDYNPEPKLSTITAPVLWINSADDFINPPELEMAQKLVTRMPHARFILVPASMETYGHGTHTQAAVWKNDLIQLLQESAKK